MNKFSNIAKDKVKGKKIKEMRLMLKEIAWNTFKQTGDINTFLELRQLEDIEDLQKVEQNEQYKDEGNNNSRK